MTDVNALLSAVNAYRNQMKLTQEAGSVAAVSENNPSFSQMVEGAIKDSIGAQHKSEELQMQSLTTGKVELSDLVTAVASADLTLNTVIAVRDRVISAYEDIIKMPI